VQQREHTRRDGTGLIDDRPVVLFLAGFSTVAAVVYGVLALFIGPTPSVSWLAILAIFVGSAAAMVAAYRGAVRLAVLLTVSGLWSCAAILVVVAGRLAPSAQLFTITVVLAALASGRHVAAAVMTASAAVMASVWWWLPNGVDPAAGALIGQRRPIADLELFLFGSLVALWWSWRTERSAHEHHHLRGNEQILQTLRQAVASSRAGIAIADANGLVTYANDALLEMWRLVDPREALGRAVFDFWAEPDVARVALMGFADGTAPVAKLRGRRADGTEFDVEVSGSQVLDADGNVAGYIGSFVDVTERTLAEERLHFERARTRAIVDSVLDIVVILDANGTIVFENAAVERVLGFRPGDRIGQSILEHAHPDDVAAGGASMAEILTDPQKSARIVMRFRHRDGSWRWLETVGRNLFHVPAIGGILGVGRDVTGQEEMRARLEATERLETVGRLAGGVAHDFNNLLTAILGNAELARSMPDTGSTMERYLDGVMQAGERARDLTRKLLAFARREIAQAVVIDLRERLTDAGELLRRLLGEDIALEIQPGDAPLPVLMDPVQFEQVVLNLAVNARDAMPGGGRFRILAGIETITRADASFIGTLAPGRCVRLTFQDSGRGMPPEVAARVFEPFFTTKDLGRGTGLGLSTVYGSVMQAKGAVRVTSRPGDGTTFEIILPAADGPVTTVHQAVPAAAPPQTAHVLVVEDDAGARAFMTEVLVAGGCTVIEAVDGVHGMAVADANADSIDLLVTDVVMPNKNGLQLAAHCRAIKPGMPVLFVTGYSADPTIEAQAQALGAHILIKPFTIDQLLGHVRQLLDRTR
jgi:PAS domain S-box-containing protein